MPDLAGRWINQNGSTLELEYAGEGLLVGTFCSRKGRAASGKEYRLSGVQSDELASFNVVWRDSDADLHAITSFSGRYLRGPEEAIHTVWVLSRQYEDEARQKPTGTWNAFLTNADVFKRHVRLDKHDAGDESDAASQAYNDRSEDIAGAQQDQ